MINLRWILWTNYFVDSRLKEVWWCICVILIKIVKIFGITFLSLQKHNLLMKEENRKKEFKLFFNLNFWENINRAWQSSFTVISIWSVVEQTRKGKEFEISFPPPGSALFVNWSFSSSKIIDSFFSPSHNINGRLTFVIKLTSGWLIFSSRSKFSPQTQTSQVEVRAKDKLPPAQMLKTPFAEIPGKLTGEI